MKKVLHRIFGVATEDADAVAAMLNNMLTCSDDIAATCKFTVSGPSVVNNATRAKIQEHIRNACTQAIERKWPVTALLLNGYASVYIDDAYECELLSKQDCTNAASAIVALSERLDAAQKPLETLDNPTPNAISSLLYEFADHSPNEARVILAEQPSECAAYMISQLRRISAAPVTDISALVVAMLFGLPKQIIYFVSNVPNGVVRMYMEKYGTDTFCEQAFIHEVISGGYNLDSELQYYIMAMVGANELVSSDSNLISAAHANACKLMQAIA